MCSPAVLAAESGVYSYELGKVKGCLIIIGVTTWGPRTEVDVVGLGSSLTVFTFCLRGSCGAITGDGPGEPDLLDVLLWFVLF